MMQNFLWEVLLQSGHSEVRDSLVKKFLNKHKAMNCES